MKDSAGNLYVNVNNVRLTYVRADTRRSDKDWPGQDVIRIQAYRVGTDGPLHQGAEFPVGKPEEALRFVAALCQLFLEATSA